MFQGENILKSVNLTGNFADFTSVHSKPRKKYHPAFESYSFGNSLKISNDGIKLNLSMELKENLDVRNISVL